MTEIQGIAVSLSAIIATITFIVSVVGQIRARRSEGIEKWQRAAVQQIFQSSKEPLSFDEIGQKYRNESIAYRHHKLRGEDLAPQTLRLIIMNLVTDQIIIQLSNDNYMLNSELARINSMRDVFLAAQTNSATAQTSFMDTMISGMMAGMKEVIPTHIAQESQTSSQVFNFIQDEPFKFTVGDMALKVSQTLKLEPDIVRAHIIKLIARKWLTTDSHGRLGLGIQSHTLSANAIDDDDDER
ncbi:hypothetical protein LOC51_03825 [Rubrivivax sp. JA1024]|nr:hypothetical protein [Rubrivivax sp. JA1024]